MRIRHFERMDVRRFKPNEFSHTKGMDFVFDDPNFYKFSLVGDKGDIYAIICFMKYWGNNYVAFFLICEDMPKLAGHKLKNFIFNAIEDLGADRVQTDSADDETLNKWHEYLGFTYEGTREKMMHNKDFNMWGLLRGRDF